MTKYEVGKEPANVKKRLKTLFDKLDSAYPDKVIVGLHKNHKKWGETVTELYRLLDYPDGKSFLEAYGYKYETASPGGRPKTVDLETIIIELKSRYPDGPKCWNVNELRDQNPDYSGKLKTLANNAKTLFGMGFADYLCEQGLLYDKNAKKELREKTAQSKKDELEAKQAELQKTREEETNRIKKKREEYFTNPEGRDYYDQFETSIKNNKITITKLKKITPVIRIPEMINEYPVNVIARGAFDVPITLAPSDINQIEIIIPNTVTTIEACPFGRLSRYIYKISLSNRLSAIPKEMFKNCVSLKEIIIPERVTKIGSTVFFNCPSLEKVYIPSSVQTISDFVFGNVEKHDGDSYISQQTAFIVSPKSYAEHFFSDYSIESFDGTKQKLNVVSQDLPLEAYGTRQLFDFECDTDATIAIYNNLLETAGKMDKVNTLIVPSSFRDKDVTVLDSKYKVIKGYKELFLPSTIKEVVCLLRGIGRIVVDNSDYFSADDYALYDRDKKTLVRFYDDTVSSFNVPSTVRVIGDYAFKECINLKSITFTDDISYVGKNAFENCNELRHISGIDFVHLFGDSCFKHTPNYLIQENINPSNIYSKYKDTGDEKYIVPEGTMVIGQEAFSGADLQSVDLPASLRIIKAKAFSNMQSLKKVVIPEGVIRLGDNCFNNCRNLEEVYLPLSVEYIGDHAFDRCVSLKMIQIPSSLKALGKGAIPSNTEISVKESNKQTKFISENGILYSSDKTVLYRFPKNYKEDRFTIPSSVKIIKNSAFIGNMNLQEIKFDGIIEEFEENCISDCESLKYVEFFDDQKEIKRSIVIDKDDKSVDRSGVVSKCHNLCSIKLPRALKVLGAYVFRDCGLTEIDIPERVAEIEEGAFCNNRIESVSFPKSVISVGKYVFGNSLKQISLYDTLEPNIREAKVVEGINSISYESNIGLLNINAPYWKNREYIEVSNQSHPELLVTVKSAVTDEVKYRVLMPPVDEQHYWIFYELFSSGWGRNASFDFKYFDDNFNQRVVYNKSFYAMERYHQSDKSDYTKHIRFYHCIKTGSDELIKTCIKNNIVEYLYEIEQLKLIDQDNIYRLLDYSQKTGNKHFEDYLLNQKKIIEQNDTAPAIDLKAFRKLNKADFEYETLIDINDPSFIVGTIWAKGFTSETNKLKKYLNNKHFKYSEKVIDDYISEINILERGVKEIFTDFAPLRVTALCENRKNGKVLTIYSESGYRGITKIKDSGSYDYYSDEEEGRWALANDVMDNIHVSYTGMKYGERVKINYSFPFKKLWNQNNYIIEYRGDVYCKNSDDTPNLSLNYVKNGILYVNTPKVTGELPELFTEDFAEQLNDWLYGVDVESYSAVRIGNTVTEISGYVFSDNFAENKEINEFIVASSNRYFSSRNGWLLSKDGTQLIAIPPKSITNELIIENVKGIASAVIVGNMNVKKIVIKEGVLEIEEDAFMLDQEIDIYLPQSLTKIGAGALTDNMTIHAPENSFAFEFALNNKLHVVKV